MTNQVQTVRVFENGVEQKSFTIDWAEIEREKAEGANHQTAVNMIAVRGTPEAALASIRYRAEQQMKRYPQYAGEFSGPEWSLRRVTRTVKTKLGVAFVRGDVIMVRPETMMMNKEDYAAAHMCGWSLRNRILTSVPKSALKEVK